MKKYFLFIFLFFGIISVLGVTSAINCRAYTCSAWSACDNNQKTRTCQEVATQREHCGETQKPDESQPCDIMTSNLVCKDSDTSKDYNIQGVYGDEYYGKGHLVNEKQNASYDDTCTDLKTPDASQPWSPTNEGKILMEYYCNGDNYQYHAFECPLGCKDGACINPCVDEGKDYYKKGVAYIDYSGQKKVPDEAKYTTDHCEGENQLREYSCDNGSVGISSENYYCPLGCKDGACIKVEPENTQPVNMIEKIEKIQNETVKSSIKKESDLSYLCSGCVLDKKCYSFGFRKDNNYCDDKNSIFIAQLKSDSYCENNFVCSSNVCVSGKCIDEGLINRILNWFKHLFG